MLLKGGMTPLFSNAAIRKTIFQFAEKKMEQQRMGLAYLGEQFINQARLTGSYTDRTGNLRSSIGYAIIENGKISDLNLLQVKGGTEGVSAAEKFARELAATFKNGLVLVCFAGMEYAAAVEAKSYDVITGSLPGDNEVKTLLTQIMKQAS